MEIQSLQWVLDPTSFHIFLGLLSLGYFLSSASLVPPCLLDHSKPMNRLHWQPSETIPLAPKALQSLLLPSTSYYNCSSAESCVDRLFPFPHLPTLPLNLVSILPPNMTLTLLFETAFARSLVTFMCKIHWIFFLLY